jgi:predicted Zn-dependent protease
VVGRLVAVADDPGAFEWEAKLVKDDATANAWCLPGGKMAVYTGILPYTQDDTGLAVVMAHEIGHAVARHGAERMTHSLGVESMLALAGGEGWSQYLGTAANLLVFMPWGRKQELEADHIGLIYMARAGYDPREAELFWQRMSEGKGGGPPEFLSTHPSDETRIKQIRDLLPEALEEYRAPGARP